MDKCPICEGGTFWKINDLFDERYGAKGKYSIEFCVNCGFGKTYPPIKDKDIPQFYSEHYPLRKVTSEGVVALVDKSSLFKRWLLGTNNVAHFYVPNGKKVLDIGSASGVSLLEMQANGIEAYGVEPDPNGQKLAKKLGLKVFKGLITDNPFPRQKFDYVTASQVLEHCSDPILFLSCAKEKLNNSGKVIFSVPNCDSIFRKVFGRRWINWHIPYHLNHFSKKSIFFLAEKVDLRLEKIKTITPNVWTAYQLAGLFNQAKEGITNPLWTGKDSNGFLDRLKLGWNQFFIKMMTILVTPVNRLVDLFGFGDSLLIVLVKGKQR